MVQKNKELIIYMKQKRLLIIANVLPILFLVGEVALIANHQTGWAVAISIAVAIASFLLFRRFPYGEETIFVAANVSYMVAIGCFRISSLFLNLSAAICVGLLLGVVAILLQGILTIYRIQGRI